MYVSYDNVFKEFLNIILYRSTRNVREVQAVIKSGISSTTLVKFYLFCLRFAVWPWIIFIILICSRSSQF